MKTIWRMTFEQADCSSGALANQAVRPADTSVFEKGGLITFDGMSDELQYPPTMKSTSAQRQLKRNSGSESTISGIPILCVSLSAVLMLALSFELVSLAYDLANCRLQLAAMLPGSQPTISCREIHQPNSQSSIAIGNWQSIKISIVPPQTILFARFLCC